MKHCILIMVVLISSLFAQEKIPKISLVDDKYDFGEVKEGEIVSHNFEIKNIGSKELKILNVRASCGCTAAKPEKDLLNPGESTFISVSFNTRLRKGMQRKHVYIFSNDPKNTEVRISFTADVIPKGKNISAKRPRISVSKSRIDFGETTEGEILSAEVIVSNSGKAKLKIGRVKSSCGCTAALLDKKELNPMEKSKLKIDMDTSGRNGEMVRTITLFSNDPITPYHTITLIANIKKG